MNHRPWCQRPDERTHRFPLASGEVALTTVCQTCGARRHRVVDRDDLDDDDQLEPEPRPKGWPWPPPSDAA